MFNQPTLTFSEKQIADFQAYIQNSSLTALCLAASVSRRTAYRALAGRRVLTDVAERMLAVLPPKTETWTVGLPSGPIQKATSRLGRRTTAEEQKLGRKAVQATSRKILAKKAKVSVPSLYNYTSGQANLSEKMIRQIALAARALLSSPDSLETQNAQRKSQDTVRKMVRRHHEMVRQSEQILHSLNGKPGKAEETATQKEIRSVCGQIADTLVEKNRAYGDSVFQAGFFSKASAEDRIKDRIDDKLLRLTRGDEAGEDVVLDLIGYLVLLKIARARRKALDELSAEGQKLESKDGVFQ